MKVSEIVKVGDMIQLKKGSYNPEVCEPFPVYYVGPKDEAIDGKMFKCHEFVYDDGRHDTVTEEVFDNFIEILSNAG